MEIKKVIREALDKHLITKLAVWDFDGTLLNSPLPTTGKDIYKEKTGNIWPHKGWWSKEDSLNPNIFDIPVIEPVIKAYEHEKTNPNTLNVMLTGRIKRLSNHVEALLKANGLTFDKHIYNMGGQTIDSKLKSLDELLVEYPNVTSVLLTDDRQEHIPAFEAWCTKQKESGRITDFKINLVPSGHH